MYLRDGSAQTILRAASGPEMLVGSMLGSLCCLMQRPGFDPPLGRTFPVEGIFPLELTWVLSPVPKKTLSDESINRGPVYRLDSKDPDIHVLDG